MAVVLALPALATKYDQLSSPVAGQGEGEKTERELLQPLGGCVLKLRDNGGGGVVLAGVTAGIGDIPWGTIPLYSEGFSRLQALLNVTAAATAAGDTLDVLVDASLDNGVEWFNIIHFTQVLGNGGAVSFIARTPSAAAGSMSAVTSDLAAGNATVPFAGNTIRVRTKRAQASAASFTIDLTIALLP